MKSFYTRKEIPLPVKKELETSLNCKSLKDIKGRAFTKVLEHINATILERCEKRPGYKSYFNVKNDTDIFTAKSLHRYFEGSPIRTDKLHALLCFLNYEPERLAAGIQDKKKAFSDAHFDSLTGTYYSYIFDISEPSPNKVKRTVLFLTRKNQYYFDVQYEGLRGRFTGSAEIVKNSIVFFIESLDKNTRIFLSAELPIEGANDNSNQIILNLFSLANSLSGEPVISHVIMVKVNRTDVRFDRPETIARFLKTKPVTLVYNNLNPDTQLNTVPIVDGWKEKEIITYLSRNKTRNKKLKAFSPNSFEQLALRNNTADQKNSRANYDKLKIKLQGHIFYAFNRFRQRMNEVAVFSYTFDFIDEERVAIANRHPVGNPGKIEYTGEIFLIAEKIYMDLNDANRQHRKQFIAPFNCIPDNISKTFIFRGITSSVSTLTGSPMALRELIVCIPVNFELDPNFINENDKTNGYISYDDFRKLPADILKNEEKLFLANQSMSTLTFPAKTDTTFIYYRQDKARKYEGTYSLFTFSSDPGIQPLKMALIIDSLSQVTLKIKYDSAIGSEIYPYHGVCEFYNNSLRIGVHYSSEYPNDERHSEFIFDPITERNHKKPFLLSGINLTTDENNKALAMRFVAVRNDWLQTGFKNQNRSENESDEIGPVIDEELKYIGKRLTETQVSAPELTNYLLWKHRP